MNNDFFIKNSFSKFIEITGKDRVEFIQGLITNDIYKCKNDNPIYACLLSPQGKFLADFFIILQSNSYLIEIHEKYFESFLLKLEIYKLRSNVNFIQNENIISMILFSKKNFKILNEIANFKDPRNKNVGQKIFIKNKKLTKIKNVNEKSFDLYKEILIKNLVPFSPDDLIENKSLLLENNLQNLQAIDWDKGCYIGQEITARMKYRALLKKQIYNFKIVSGKIKIGDKLVVNNIIFGEVLSKVNEYIICMLKIDLVSKKSEKKEKIRFNDSVILKFL